MLFHVPGGKVLARLPGYGDGSWLDRVTILPVASDDAIKQPTVSLDEANRVTNFRHEALSVSRGAHDMLAVTGYDGSVTLSRWRVLV